MTVAHIKPAEVETFSLDWGTMKWFVSPVTIPGAANSQGEVIVNPGQGHAPHLHEQADELIYVISGTGTQTVGDEDQNAVVNLARIAWLGTVGACLIAVLILLLEGYYGYAGVTFAVAVAAFINLL